MSMIHFRIAFSTVNIQVYGQCRNCDSQTLSKEIFFLRTHVTSSFS